MFKMFLKKVKCLVNTYKSGVLSCKLPKMTKCIYKGIYFILSIKFLLLITIGIYILLKTEA